MKSKSHKVEHSNKNTNKNDSKIIESNVNEKYTLITETINDIYLKMEKMEKKIDNTVKWVGNMCIATIIGIIFIVLSMGAITYTIINKLLK